MFGLGSSDDDPEYTEEKLTDDVAEQEEQRDTTTIFDEPYYFEQVPLIDEPLERAGPHHVKEDTADGDVVAGPKPRHMIERAGVDPTRPLWLGYDSNAQDGFREGPVPFEALKRHMWISGTTGSGKTTLLQNKAVQHAYGGYGFCNIDPKADGDTLELIRMLPKHRLSDVILLEPGSQEFYRTVGINMLDMPAIENDAQREKEIESRLENLIAIFDSDEYWGPKMGSITESMGRAMLRHNGQVALDPDRDPNEKYTVIDLYFILLNAERRVEFLEEVDDPYLREGLKQIAEMDNDDVRPLTRRIKSWVENAIVRKIISNRDSTIDWDEIVDEGKILLVRIPVASEDVHQMIALTVIRNLWSAKKRQVRDPNRETTPYFLQLDEFERIANDNLQIENMLVRARSMWLSVCLGTQYPYQIEKDHSDVMRAIENNANTLVAMKTPGERDARLLMTRFRDYDKADLINTDLYECWTKLPLPDGKENPPAKLDLFPPYPPLRSKEDAKQVIRYSLKQYGDEPLSDAQIQRELKYGNFTEVIDPENAPGADFNPDSGGGPSFDDTKTGGGMDATNLPAEDILECVYAAQVKYADERTKVPAEKVREEIKLRYGDTGYESLSSNVFEKNDNITTGHQKGEPVVGLTDTGRNKVFSADTGSSGSGGKDMHRLVLKESYRAFTALGAITTLPTQEGESLPDGVADLPINPLEDATTTDEVYEFDEQLQEEYPRLYEISNKRDISIEAETSTITKPVRTLNNLRKAIEADKTCVFTCKDATFDDKDYRGFEFWPSAGEGIIYAEDDSGDPDYDTILCANKQDADGNRTFYNASEKFRLSRDMFGVWPATNERTNVTWKEAPTDDGQDKEIIMQIDAKAQDEPETVARFGGPDEIKEPTKGNFMAYREKNDNGDWVVRVGTETANGYWMEHDSNETHGPYETVSDLKEDWSTVVQPFVPEAEFPRMPRDDDFTFVIFPDDANEDYTEPYIYEQGELEPLFIEDDSEGNGDDWEPAGGGGTSNSAEESDSETVDGGQSTTQPEGECPECGEQTTFTEGGEMASLTCDSCGYTPRKEVREEIRSSEGATSDGQREGEEASAEQPQLPGPDTGDTETAQDTTDSDDSTEGNNSDDGFAL